MNVLLIGAPGSGKGTQGQRLAARLGLRHIATGDILRQQIADQTELGRQITGYLDRGELVPDEVVIDMVLPLIAEAVAGDGYLLDGFPRSVEQAERVRAIVAGLGGGRTPPSISTPPPMCSSVACWPGPRSRAATTTRLRSSPTACKSSMTTPDR